MSRLKVGIACVSFAAFTGLFISCVSHKSADFSAHRSPAADSDSERIATKLGMWKPDPKDLSFIELGSILEKNQFSRIEDLLSYLKQYKPEYMSHYAVMSNSLSLHESSLENPRVIIYGRSANFVITFNGSSSQEAYRMLEVMEFDSVKKEFSFREIEFKEESEIQKPYSISKVNGPDDKCLTCHSNARPIWNAYPLWPGAYGGVDDEGPGRSVAPDRGFKRIFGEKYKKTATEQWANFVQNKKSNSRYQHLPELANSTFFQNAYNLKVYDKSYSIPRPNSDLNIALGTHNYQRIARILKTALTGDDIQYALLYMYSHCMTMQLPQPNPGKDLLRSIFNSSKNETKKAWENFLAGSVRQLAKDHNITSQQIVENINRNRWTGEPLFKYTTDDDLFSSIVKDISFRVEQGSPNFIEIVKRYVPEARAETFPMQVYEGIYLFATGDEPADNVFKYLMFNQVFEPKYLAYYSRLAANLKWEQTVQYCHDLDSRMLPRLRQLK